MLRVLISVHSLGLFLGIGECMSMAVSWGGSNGMQAHFQDCGLLHDYYGLVSVRATMRLYYC